MSQSIADISETAPKASSPRKRSGKREAIISAAKEIFFREGYAGASMDRITANASVSKATVYSYFRSKEDLLMAVVEAVIVPVRDDFLSSIDQSAGLEQWLIELGGIIARKALTPDLMLLERLVIAEALRFPELARIYQTIAVDSSFEVLLPKMRRLIRDGRLRRCEPIAALHHFAELCTGALRRDALLNEGKAADEDQIDRHVAEMVNVFLHGYAAPPVSRSRQGRGGANGAVPGQMPIE